MATSQEPLRQRFCRGADRGVAFWICRHCDRGHQYRGERCRQKARRQQRRAANRRHQQSRERGNVSSTLHLIVSAIHARSKDAGLPDPTRNETVRRALRVARMRGHEPRQATGLTHRNMLKIAPFATPKQWALLQLMRDCMLRTSEASAARWRDLEPEPDGTGRLTIPSSKTDQEGKGAVLYVSTATMEALKLIRPGLNPAVGEKIFRWCPRTICRIIARLAQQAELRGDYSGHSPRIGMVHDLARLGALLPEIQNAGRWSDPSMPARYIRSIDTGKSAVAKYSRFL